jgi:hypothetical protein
MKTALKKMRIKDIKIDYDLWPRYLTRIDSTNLGRIRDAIRAGKSLPPLILSDPQDILIDGLHRYTGYKGLFGEDHEVDVEPRKYKTRLDMLVDATAINCSHGMALDTKDRIHTILKMKQMGASNQKICEAMAFTKNRLDKYMERTAENSDGNRVALPRGAEHLADQETPLSKEQEKLLPKIGGALVASQARMLIAQIKAKAVDLNNPRELAVLVELRDLLFKTLP